MLPGCDEPICCKVIRNMEARFNNRKRPKGWLTPTARQLLQTHINIVKKIRAILPISGIVIEINRFDFAKMENPGIKNWEYQKGRLFGFKDVYEAVSYQQGGKCLLCSKHDIEHYHHLVPRHKGGSDTLDNFAGLCFKCHEKVHTDPKAMDNLLSKATGLKKKYHALSVINQVIPGLLQKLSETLPTYVTTGYETKCIRGLYELEKDHYIDAWCIAVSILDADTAKPDFNGSVHPIMQYRRHDRAFIKAQTERTYKLGGKVVAKNRRPRFEQQGPALSDLNLTKREVSKLTVVKSSKRYNTKGRLLPGTKFTYDGKTFVLSGQLTGGLYYRAAGDRKMNYPAKKCNIAMNNSGLVFT